jgi:hypothetical protein
LIIINNNINIYMPQLYPQTQTLDPCAELISLKPKPHPLTPNP